MLPSSPRFRGAICWLPGLLFCLSGLLPHSLILDAQAASGARSGIVSTVNPLASEAALQAFKRGGNAVDAAVAAGLTLGVVDGHNSGIGGGCFLLIRKADGTVLAIDGRETAPAAAHRDMYMKDGVLQPEWSQTGPLAAGVPGALAAYDKALKEAGKLSLGELLLPAAELAEQGIRVDGNYRKRLTAKLADLNRYEGSREIFAGAVLSGRLVQKDLAATYRGVARAGIRWFYEGPFAESVDGWMREHGGILTRDDFKAYAPRRRVPVRTTYRDFEIIGFPPPSSGGVHVAQILNILENFDIAKMKPGSADLVHLVVEAMKLAFADRAYWLGDPDYAPVPRGLVSKEYARELASRIDLRKARPVPGHGNPPDAATDLFGKHTTHFSTADAEGNWVACTATINTSFGSKVVVPGTGVVLNNEMDDFTIQPGVPNFFGLLGAEANTVQAGKRPLSSMSPTLVLHRGRPIASLGAAGGPTIISQTVLALIHMLDFNQDPAQALKQPRYHHQWRPEQVKIEAGIGPDVLQELKARGHQFGPLMFSFGATQVVAWRPEWGRFRGAHDPRVEGKVLTW